MIVIDISEGVFICLHNISYSHWKLPISNQFLKDAQYLQPDERYCVSSLKAISRLSLAVATSLKNHLQSVFSVSETATVSEVVDLIRNQWHIYQLSDIPKEWHTIETVPKRLQHSKSPTGERLKEIG